LGDIFLELGAFFTEKYRPKFTLISSRFGQLFVVKFPNFDQKFVWAKVLIYQGSILGDIMTKLGAFFTKRLVTLQSTLAWALIYWPRYLADAHSERKHFEEP
jgi:hypothetical protein